MAQLSRSVLRSIEAIGGALQATNETSEVDEFFHDLAVSDPAEVDVPAEVAFGRKEGQARRSAAVESSILPAQRRADSWNPTLSTRVDSGEQ